MQLFVFHSEWNDFVMCYGASHLTVDVELIHDDMFTIEQNIKHLLA